MSTEFYPLPLISSPIFRSDRPGAVLFYAPGYLVAAQPGKGDEIELGLIREGSVPHSPVVADLVQYAHRAQQLWNERVTRAFTPVCLVLYVNNRCQLACTYCYSGSGQDKLLTLNEAAVMSAAKLVAANCHVRQLPFSLVFHGGGEPTLDTPLVDSLLRRIEALCHESGLTMFRYVATNGVMSAAKAAWMAGHFDLVGLSCDGPSSIQSRQRPVHGGYGSGHFVEQTAEILRSAGTPFHVRVTITKQTFRQQVEIADYVCRSLHPLEIHAEPVYSAGRAGAHDIFAGENAPEFMDQFWQAQQLAAGYGIRWLMSGTRPWEIHGPYCQIYRGVLQLIPGDIASACFKSVDTVNGETWRHIGRTQSNGELLLDKALINSLYESLSTVPVQCQTCFNQFHCTRGCPDICMVNTRDPIPEFRCRVSKLTTEHAIDMALGCMRSTNAPLELSGIALDAI